MASKGTGRALGWFMGLAAAACATPAWAQCQVSKLTAESPAAGDEFGGATGISGDYAVIGARQFSPGGIGEAYVFQRGATGWLQDARLTSSDGVADDQFGRSAAIDGETIVVGATGQDGGGLNAGAAYVFQRLGGNWVQTAKLTASEAAIDDAFGVSAGISGSFIVVGAVGDDDGGNGSGSAYVFRLSGGAWVQAAKLRALDAAADDQFGLGVAISGDYALAGAYFDDDSL